MWGIQMYIFKRACFSTRTSFHNLHQLVLFSYVLLTEKKSVVQWKSCGNSVPKFWVNFNWELFKQQFWASILITRIIKLPWKQSSPSSHTAKAKTKALQAKKAELKGIHSQKKRCAHLPLSSTPTPRGSKKAQIPSKWAQEKQVWSLCHH